MFSNLLLMTTLGDPRALESLEPLKSRFKDDANALAAVKAYEVQLGRGVKK
jgi:hypothetical protein